MSGTPGEALDTDEAILACENANESAEVVFGYGCSGGNGWWFEFISALNEQDVVLVWDPPKPTTDRPGGWVPGVGWVAVASPALDRCVVKFHQDGDAEVWRGDPAWLDGRIVIVTAWADGTIPTEGDR